MLKLLFESFLLILRSVWSANVTCIQFFFEVVSFHANICWRFILWAVNIATLPLRALNALQKEKMMESTLQEMQIEVENLSWKNDKLEACLKMAVKERNLIESILTEVEEQHEVAIEKIERLEKQVEFLKDTNLRFRESNSKGQWDSTNKSNVLDEPIPATFKVKKKNPAAQVLTKTGNPTGLVDPLTPLVFSSSIDANLALHQRRDVAIFQSVFSAMLSLLVGAIIWEAKDPCMPLVVALFSVVGLSLRSVVQFFSTINNRPASDAVALLSFNWFILGTLTAPTLPKLAPLLSPIVRPVLRKIGLYSSNVSFP
ncbi:hypothetical protein vseg_016604 [Gypsophila vaccaria]